MIIFQWISTSFFFIDSGWAKKYTLQDGKQRDNKPSFILLFTPHQGLLWDWVKHICLNVTFRHDLESIGDVEMCFLMECYFSRVLKQNTREKSTQELKKRNLHSNWSIVQRISGLIEASERVAIHLHENHQCSAIERILKEFFMMNSANTTTSMTKECLKKRKIAEIKRKARNIKHIW